MINMLVLSSFTTKTQKPLEFCIVSKPGYITNQHGSVVYICQDSKDFGIDRYVYNVSLTKGTYSYYNMDKSDTITFAIDKNGAYKLGFYEDHKSFSIYKNDPFSQSLVLLPYDIK